jgi:ABC-type cobalamin/Fe3+-siderophores transport system ATPase subunit
VIAVESLTRAYGSFTAVDDVSFSAQPGRVTGFLGPNGAGKSTTMRIIVGLTQATSGVVRVLGRSYVDLPNPGLEVGVLLDASAQHAGRTGREILTIAQRFMGLPRSRVEQMLDLVRLTPAEASRRVRDYFVMGCIEDLGTLDLGVRVVGVRISNVDQDLDRSDPADLARRSAHMWRGIDLGRGEHAAPVAIGQVSVCDSAAVGFDDQSAVQAEGLAEPIDGRRGVVVE